MEKLYFDSHALKLYSEDLQNLQDNIQAEIIQAYRQTIDHVSSSAVISGFNISLNADPTKINITHPSVVGSFITESGSLVTDSVNRIGLAPSGYTDGDVYVVYAERSIIYGSYDKLNDAIVENVQSNIDFSTYTLVYDRTVERCVINIVPQATYTAIVDKTPLCFLGEIITHGVGQPLTISTTGRVTVSQKILDGSITLDKLSPTIVIPQDNVAGTSTGLLNEDYAPVQPELPETYLYQDLNRFRSEIKSIKGMPHWYNSAGSTLVDINPNLLASHINGVFESGLAGDDFDATLHTSTGLYPNTSTGIESIQIRPGKYLYNGTTKAIFSITSRILGDQAVFNRPEGVFTHEEVDFTSTGLGPVLADTTYVIEILRNPLYYGVVNDDSVVIVNLTGVPGDPNYGAEIPRMESAENWSVTNGVITIYSTGVIGGTNDAIKKIGIGYRYGQRRYDAIDFTSDGQIVLVNGTPGPMPIPPALTANSLRFYLIERIPFQQSNIIDCRFYTQSIRDVVNIHAHDLSENATFATNKFTYFTPAGLVDSNFEHWTLSGRGSKSYMSSSSKNATIKTMIYCKDDDDVYIRVSKLPAYARVKVDIEITPSSDIYQSRIYDLYSSIRVDDTQIQVAELLPAGMHKVVITILSDEAVLFWGLIVGRSELEYTSSEEHRISRNEQKLFVGESVVVGSPQSSSYYTKDIGAVNPWNTIGVFKNNIYVFNSASSSYTVYDPYSEEVIQTSIPLEVGDSAPEVFCFSDSYIIASMQDTDHFYVSLNGLDWSVVNLPNMVSIYRIKLVNGKVFILPTSISTTYFVLSSNFSVVESYSLPISRAWKDITYFNGEYIFLSIDNIVKTTTFLTYTQVPISPAAWRDLTTNPEYSELIISGSGSSLIRTTDTNTFEQIPIPCPSYKSMFYVDTAYYIIPTSTDVIYYSYDLRSWKTLELAGDTSNTIFTSTTGSLYAISTSTSMLIRYDLLRSFVVNGRVAINGDIDINGNVTVCGSINANSNYVYNGGFTEWGHGTSFSSVASGASTSTRYTISYSGSPTLNVSKYTLSQVDRDYIGQNIDSAIQVAQTAAGAGTTSIEYVNFAVLNARQFQSKTLTLSFWIKTSLSSDYVSGRYTIAYGSGGSASDTNIRLLSHSPLEDGAWKKVTAKVTLPDFFSKTWGSDYVTASSLSFSLGVESSEGDTPNIVRTIQITGIKLEDGSITTPFKKSELDIISYEDITISGSPTLYLVYRAGKKAIAVDFMSPASEIMASIGPFVGGTGENYRDYVRFYNPQTLTAKTFNGTIRVYYIRVP